MNPNYKRTLAIAMKDAEADARNRAGKSERMGIVGYGVSELWRGPELISADAFANIITDAGDEYYARKVAVGISPANLTAPTAVDGMKFGIGTTAAAKSGAGAALVTYTSGSQLVFDASYPAISEVGTDVGWLCTYKCTWGAGVATADNIREVVIVTDADTNATSAAADTIARSLITEVDKAAGDTLVVTWNHKFLGA